MSSHPIKSIVIPAQPSATVSSRRSLHFESTQSNRNSNSTGKHLSPAQAQVFDVWSIVQRSNLRPAD